MKRRTFLQRLSAGGLGMAMATNTLLARESAKLNRFGIQLYTVRQAMGEDPAGTLERLAKIGYDYVEGAGYQEGEFYGQSAAGFKKMLADTGLIIPSGHTLTGRMNPEATKTMVGGDWEGAVADFAAVGQQYVVLAWLQESEREHIDQYKELAELLNKSGEVCKSYGLQLAYHNHDFEFQMLNGQLPMDVLLKETDPELVKVELDIYWINRAGYDPLNYFKKYPGRFPLWHVKDMDDTERQFFTEVGNGTIDWQRVFAARDTAGLDYFFVEQDVSKNPFDSVKQSYKFLKRLKY